MPRRKPFPQTSAKPPGLIGHWRFNELGGIAIDYSGAGNHAPITAAPRVRGNVAALSFNGSSSLVDLGSAAALRPSTGDLSCFAWVKLGNADADRVVVGDYSTDGWQMYFVANDDANYPNFFAVWLEKDPEYKQYVFRISDPWLWHYVGFTWDNSEDALVLYVDGDAVTHTAVQDDTLTGDDVKSATNVYIGRNGTTSYFDGIVDDVQMYSTVITAAGAKALAEQLPGNFGWYDLEAMQDYMMFLDDFHGDQIQDEWRNTGDSGGSAAVVDAQTGGIVRITTDGDDDDEWYMDWADTRSLLVSKKVIMECRVKASDDDSDIETYYSIWEDGGDWIMFWGQPSETNWQIYTVLAGGGGGFDSGIARDTSYHKFKIECHTHGGNHVHFYIDGTETSNSPITSDIPTNYLQPFFKVITKENVAKTIDIDYIYIIQER